MAVVAAVGEGEEGEEEGQMSRVVAVAVQFSRFLLLLSRDAYWGYRDEMLGDVSLQFVTQVHNLHYRRREVKIRMCCLVFH